MSSSESVRSAGGFGPGVWILHVFPGIVSWAFSVSKPDPYLSVLQSYWNLHVWNRKEALFLSSVSRYLGLSIVFTSDLEYSGGCATMYDTSMNTAMSVRIDQMTICSMSVFRTHNSPVIPRPLHTSATKEIDNVANRADQ